MPGQWQVMASQLEYYSFQNHRTRLPVHIDSKNCVAYRCIRYTGITHVCPVWFHRFCLRTKWLMPLLAKTGREPPKTQDVLHRWCHIALWSSRRPSEIERRAMTGEQAPWNSGKSGSSKQPGVGNKRLAVSTLVAMDAPDILDISCPFWHDVFTCFFTNDYDHMSKKDSLDIRML